MMISEKQPEAFDIHTSAGIQPVRTLRLEYAILFFFF